MKKCQARFREKPSEPARGQEVWICGFGVCRTRDARRAASSAGLRSTTGCAGCGRAGEMQSGRTAAFRARPRQEVRRLSGDGFGNDRTLIFDDDADSIRLLHTEAPRRHVIFEQALSDLSSCASNSRDGNFETSSVIPDTIFNSGTSGFNEKSCGGHIPEKKTCHEGYRADLQQIHGFLA